ncbi:hypothetical protein DPX16_11658 [Anabarilius grahami]|uniref:Uncharacterized protein n=1 Tax=Anabarilius grahami TaxID=495550 RepID=A0A3N0Z2S4_ANAGA|nr:hypothetical protein DPX16_11658 [Anabarilius grahami]
MKAASFIQVPLRSKSLFPLTCFSLQVIRLAEQRKKVLNEDRGGGEKTAAQTAGQREDEHLWVSERQTHHPSLIKHLQTSTQLQKYTVQSITQML